ncbi:FkbM family methyltransferase [Escherichia coli]|uniref:FkbM family methyltransferase n=1 Tax=Escherichia coli TaxID=562 RepID=UPI00388DBCAE
MSAKLLPEVDVIKIDTEGAEVEILNNLNISKLLMIEYHSESDCKKIVSILDSDFHKVIHKQDSVAVGTIVFQRK